MIDGKPVDHLAPRDRDIAFVFQSYALYPHMTVFENLAFSLRLRRAPERKSNPRSEMLHSYWKSIPCWNAARKS